jgi:hypothetical protein
MRPVPLLKGSHLINFLEPHPLTNHSGMHAGYLSRKVVGDVLVVGQDPDDSAALVDFFESLPRVQHVTYVPNQTSVNAEVKAHDLGVGNKLFDSIVYSKSKTAWLGRAPDFHRLSTRIKDGGTLIAKTKWVPDSRLLSLEEIAVHGAYKYSLPVVYLRFVKSQRTLPTLSTLADGSDGESGHDEERAPFQSRPTVNCSLSKQADEIRTAFDEGARAATYSPGWSWHSALRTFVDDWLDTIEGDIVNICCGTNDQGEIRVDLLEEYLCPKEKVKKPTAATVQADARQLPIETNSVSGVISDPPWKIPVEDRIRFFSESHRIVEPGGSILYNAWWIPYHPYAVLQKVRPVTANVLDQSIGGPGGLSFLTEYRVTETPDFGAASYTLAKHMEVAGVDAISVDRAGEWKQDLPRPRNEPFADPRFLAPVSSYTCAKCGNNQFDIVNANGSRTCVCYECQVCGYRNSPTEIDDIARNGISNPDSQQSLCEI